MNKVKIRRHCFKACGQKRCACKPKGDQLDDELAEKLWKAIWEKVKKSSDRNDTN
jgi:hypothetical protein